MLLTHRLLLFILISTLAVIVPNLTPITASLSPDTNSTTTHPLISTVGINTKTTISTDSTNTSSSTTTTTTTTTTNSVTSTGENATSSVSTGNSTIPPVTVPWNTTNHPSTSPGTTTSAPVITSDHATTLPASVTTAANTTSPHHSSTQPGTATNHPVTTLGNASTTSLPAPVNSTIPSPTAGGSVTTSPFSTSGNATGLPVTPTVTTAPLFTQVNTTNTTLITSGHATTPKNNATTPPITSLGTGTPPLTTHVSPLTTHGNSTVPPVTTPGNTTSTVPTPVNATTPLQPTQATCPEVPCPALSVCVNLSCHCLAGTFLENGVCMESKSFSSVLRVNRTFSDAMNNPQSPEFKKIAIEIINAVNIAMSKQPNYIRTEVLKLRAGSIVASVNSFFETNSPVTQTLFDNTMNKAIEECSTTTCGILANANYTRTSVCEQQPLPCDFNTTECGVNNGLVSCNCRAAYVPVPYLTKSCVVCPSGQKAEKGHCVPCPFGYSGFNCNDSSLLALVVVACVLGGILLIAILAFLIYICGTRGEKSQGSYYNSPYPVEDIQATWQSQGITPIPRATLASTSSGNNLEMTEGAGRKFHNNGFTGTYDLTTEGMKTFTGKNPSRYSYLVGHENPYYLEGEDRRTT